MVKLKQGRTYFLSVMDDVQIGHTHFQCLVIGVIGNTYGYIIFICNIEQEKTPTKCNRPQVYYFGPRPLM